MNSEPRFPIGQKYTTRGKNPLICTVTDIIKTYNSNNVLVSIRYVSTHDFCGQTVTERDVCETTIARGVSPAELIVRA